MFNLLFIVEFWWTPFVVTQLLKNVVDGGKPLELNSSPVGFSIRRALASAARWAITVEKLVSNRGSIDFELCCGDGTIVWLFERRSVVGEGGGGNPFVKRGFRSSITMFFNSLG